MQIRRSGMSDKPPMSEIHSVGSIADALKTKKRTKVKPKKRCHTKRDPDAPMFWLSMKPTDSGETNGI